MHTLNITGETPEALYLNAVKMLSLFLRPPQTTAATVDDTSKEPPRSEQLADKPAGAARPRRNARATTAAKEGLNDDISAVGADKTIEHDVAESVKKPLTLEGDIIPRLHAIQAACTKRGMAMPACVSYIQKLYGPFGIANAKHLKPEQFEEFLEASEAYLNGDA